jgi:hypothetical protein
MGFDRERLKLDKFAWNIILWNLTPYWGIYFLHWEPLTVFICYALETIVIGAFNTFKLTAVYYFGKQDKNNELIFAGFGAIPVFITSYGFLAYLQLMMFFGLSSYGNFAHLNNLSVNIVSGIRYFMDDHTTFLALGVFIVSNGYSFVNDFILTQKYTANNMYEQFYEPFPRVVISQCVVFGGMFLYQAFNESMFVIFTLTTLKIYFELYFREHKLSDISQWFTR